MKKSKRSVVMLITIVMICVQYLFPLLQALANEAVDVNVMPSPTIDIVLAKSKTKVDVSSFEKDLKKELINQGIAEDRVKINAIEAVEANIQNSFTWKTDVSSTIGSIQITNNGQDIVMKGNKKYLGKNAIWMIPEKEQEQEIQFDYSVDFGDSFNAAGMLLRVKQDGDVLTGYMLSLNKSNKTWYKTAGNKYGAIWKFTYKLGTNTTNMTKTFVQGVDIQTSGTLNIKSTDTEIIISGGGLNAPLKYEIDTEYGYGFGFFSDHYSHNCSKIGAFTLGNIKLTTTTVKKFKEVLSNPEWRENSLKVLVNVDDSKNEELEDKTQFASLQTRLINEQINSVFWGTDKNKKQFNKVVEANNNHGTFIDNLDYTKAIVETVKYIKSLIDATKSSQYALIGEKVELKVTPESAETNTISPDYPQGKWKVNHDYEYFENHLGQAVNSGKYMSNLKLSFDKTGRYELLYEDGSIASKYIYVHRKPVANFSVERTGNSVVLKSTSYDLDCYSNNNGISEEEWQYKRVGETNWTSGKLTNIEQDEVYVVQLRVKDFQETWSNQATKYVMYSSENLTSTPVASFSIKNSTLSKYEELQVEDSSYDPAGLAITSKIWKVKKDGNVLYTGETPLTNYSDYQVGNYTMSLSVVNQAGKVSEEFSRTFELIEDTIVPEVAVSRANSDWANQPVSIDVNWSDKGGSGFKGYQYGITNSKEAPISWSELILKQNDTIIIASEGEKYLHVKGQDNAGNVSEDIVFGPYKIDLTKPEIESIVPENKDWTNQSIDISVTFSDKGGSEFKGYQYALTTEKATPETWSEMVKEEKATFTISGEAEYYLHLIMYDNAGNESAENIYGPYQVDKTSPEVQVNPSFSDWTNQPVTVDVSWSDEGGSDLQKYKYAITSSGITPEEWKNEVVGKTEPIIIDTEGENYLHIIGCDNAGNESTDNIFGKYKLDFTIPELIGENEINSDTKVSSIKFAAKDDGAGVSKFVVNGTEISGTEYIATSNGDYKFEISDYAGNTLTKDLKITNIYSECDKNLGHPTYDSSYAKCPICDLIEGIKVTSHEKIYEGAAVGISYDNTKKAEIVEYYNNGLDKPSKIGEYLYELKIMYDGNEYKTGIVGTFILKDKPKVENPVDDEKEQEKDEEQKQEVEILYVKSNIYPIENNGNICDVPQNTVVSEFLKNIETNASSAKVYSPENVKLENDKLIENGSALVIQKSAQQKEYKIYVKEENTSENKIETTKKPIKERLSGILPYTGGKDKMGLLIGLSSIVILSISFRKLFSKKGKH